MPVPSHARRLAACALVAAIALVLVAVALAATATVQVSEGPHHPGDDVAFTAAVAPGDGEVVTGVIWNFGDGSAPEQHAPDANVSHPYVSAGDYQVTIGNIEGEPAFGDTAGVSIVAAPPPNTAPTASIDVLTANPRVGDPVAFESKSSDAEDSRGQLEHAWEFGDGGKSKAQDPTHKYGSADAFDVTLSVTDTGGLSAFDSGTVKVTASNPGPDPDPRPDSGTGPDAGTGTGTGTGVGPGAGPGAGTAPAAPLRLMSPFPIVRLSGQLTDKGARITRLSVRAPKGARVTVRCRGRGCPRRRAKALVSRRPARFKGLERRLRAGTVLEVLVSRPGRIGKYTRFEIRSNRAPKRTDRCLLPGARKGSVCPPA